MSHPPRDVIVIGAGPAGLMAGVQAARRDRKVTVLEAGPEACLRYLASGSGAAAVSNRRIGVDSFHGRFGRFVSDALVALPQSALVQWFAERGVEIREAEHYGMLAPPG